MLKSIFQGFRYSSRALGKNPGFTVIAVITLALGIGANSAIFSMVDNLLFRPLPVPRPNELVRIFNGPVRGNPVAAYISLPNYLDYRDGASCFTGIAAYIDRFPVNVSAGKFGTERVDSGMVTANYFKLLGAKAEIGRTLLPTDDDPGAGPVVMLSHSFWRRHFSGGTSVLGMQLLIDGQPFAVVGVTPPGFGGVSFENFPDVWLPLNHAVNIDPLLKSQIPQKKQSFSAFAVIGRLKPGVSMAQAQSQLDVLGARLGAGKPVPSEGDPDFRRPWPVLVSATAAARRDYSRLSLLLLGVVGLVLLIACADVAGLMLARAESRQKESAIRLALGGTRSRIMCLQLSEGLIIALLGAMSGMGLAAVGIRLLVLASPESLPLPSERIVSLLDWRVLVFTTSVAVIAGVISTVAPAFKYSRSNVMDAIRRDARVSALSKRLSAQTMIVVLQVAASVLLLVGAGMMARTLWHAAQLPLGFDPDHGAGASTDLVRQGYDKSTAANMLDPLLDSLRAQPGVESAALGPLPLTGFMQTVIKVEGHESPDSKDWVDLTRVSPGYFATLGIPVFTGRDFARSDTAGTSGVALINAIMAQKYWPHESPLGKHLLGVGPHDQSFEIVGVVGNIPNYDLVEPPKPAVYLSLGQSYLMFPWQPDTTLLARTSGDPKLLFSAIRAAVTKIDPALPVFHERTFVQQVATGLSEQRFLARMLFLFASVALLLAGAGLFGLISYNTARAVRDIGLRLALGATRKQVLWMVLKRALLLSFSGLVIGLMAALWLVRLIASQLFRVTPTDPLTFAGVAAFMMLVTMIACYVPARRATKVDPMIALRAE